MSQNGMDDEQPYRVGNHQPQNIYRGDAYIGVMFSFADAALVVGTLNARTSDEPITVPKETAQILFDALVSSMDFGSGFLDTDEVNALRALAVILGVDPNDATPSEFTKHYPHQFKPLTDPQQADKALGIQRVVAVQTADGWTTVRNHEPVPYVPCGAGWPWCAKAEDDPIHQANERMSA